MKKSDKKILQGILHCRCRSNRIDWAMASQQLDTPIKNLRSVYYASEFYLQQKSPKVHHWTPEDEQTLLKMIEDGAPWMNIYEHFSNIKISAVKNKYYRLLRMTRSEFKHNLESD